MVMIHSPTMKLVTPFSKRGYLKAIFYLISLYKRKGSHRLDLPTEMLRNHFDPFGGAKLRPLGRCVKRRFLRQAQDTEFIEVQGQPRASPSIYAGESKG